jgi:cytoskeleton protein RodZ
MQETNESLGHFLKNKREENNFSIEQVAYATRISLKMLRALEEDDHTALPAPTFVRGYLQAYAKFARIDTQDLLLRYQHHLAMEPEGRKGAIKSHYLYVRERYQEKRRLVLVIVLFAVMLVVAGAYFALKHKREKNKELAHQAELMKKEPAAPAPGAAPIPVMLIPPVPEGDQKLEEKKPEAAPAPEAPIKPEPPKAVEAPKPAPAAVVAPAPMPTATATATAAEAPAISDVKKTYKLFLQATEDVWFRYQTDDDAVGDMMLRKDKGMVFNANKVIKIFSGNLGAMKATLNGQAIDPLVTDKKTKSLVLPASEAANVKLPLFPQFQVKKPKASESDNASQENPAKTE